MDIFGDNIKTELINIDKSKVIDNHILGISKVMFQNKKDWIYVTDKQKIEFFFIFNRFFSKMYPDKSQLLNNKNVDMCVGMDLWFHFMSNKTYPNWFWSKSIKSKEDEYPIKDYKILKSHLRINDFDLKYLIDRHPDFIKEELTYFKKLEKGN